MGQFFYFLFLIYFKMCKLDQLVCVVVCEGLVNSKLASHIRVRHVLYAQSRQILQDGNAAVAFMFSII